MTTIGYARIATESDDIKPQIELLKKYGCDAIRTEIISKSTIDSDTELSSVLNFIREGDLIVIVSLDIIARSISDLIKIIRKISLMNADILAIGQKIDTRVNGASDFLNTIQGLAQFEAAARREAQITGIKRAKRKGVYKGRKPSVPREEIVRRLGLGHGATRIAREMEVARSTVYAVKRSLPEHQGKGDSDD